MSHYTRRFRLPAGFFIYLHRDYPFGGASSLGDVLKTLDQVSVCHKAVLRVAEHG